MVERKHRQLLKVSRALFFQSKFPIGFWGYCVENAVHTINKMPLSILNNTTPYERLYKEKPSYNMMRTFGCLCYASTLDKERTKFEPRAQPSVFIGYSQKQKAYKLYCLETKKVYTSRNVKFHENIFPFHHSTTNNECLK